MLLEEKNNRCPFKLSNLYLFLPLSVELHCERGVTLGWALQHHQQCAGELLRVKERGCRLWMGVSSAASLH